MADRWTVFGSAVRHAFEGWSALHIAKQQRLGGENVTEKLEWLLEVIVQIFRDNDHVYPEELEDYISECLYNEFDMIVEDGTLQNLVGTICKYDDDCSSGRIAKVLEELRVPPPSTSAVIAQVVDESLSEDESKVSPQEDQNSSITSSNAVNLDNTSMEIDESTPMDMENGMEDDGWEVVKKSKKKKNFSKT